ncbi:MAG TPA: hypothetical protein GXZ88_08245 [Firmicutes bacterium]|jgi:hypothetical protein|nr:hypothetical protein [Candidatus Fermentithermobacillaceae bacterium]
MRFSKAIVALVISLNAAFTIAVLFIFLRVGAEPTALIAAWFGFTTVELWALAGIKKREIERGETEWKNGSTGY